MSGTRTRSLRFCATAATRRERNLLLLAVSVGRVLDPVLALPLRPLPHDDDEGDQDDQEKGENDHDEDDQPQPVGTQSTVVDGRRQNDFVHPGLDLKQEADTLSLSRWSRV